MSSSLLSPWLLSSVLDTLDGPVPRAVGKTSSTHVMLFPIVFEPKILQIFQCADQTHRVIGVFTLDSCSNKEKDELRRMGPGSLFRMDRYRFCIAPISKVSSTMIVIGAWKLVGEAAVSGRRIDLMSIAAVTKSIARALAPPRDDDAHTQAAETQPAAHSLPASRSEFPFHGITKADWTIPPRQAAILAELPNVCTKEHTSMVQKFVPSPRKEQQSVPVKTASPRKTPSSPGEAPGDAAAGKRASPARTAQRKGAWSPAKADPHKKAVSPAKPVASPAKSGPQEKVAPPAGPVSDENVASPATLTQQWEGVSPAKSASGGIAARKGAAPEKAASPTRSALPIKIASPVKSKSAAPPEAQETPCSSLPIHFSDDEPIAPMPVAKVAKTAEPAEHKQPHGKAVFDPDTPIRVRLSDLKTAAKRVRGEKKSSALFDATTGFAATGFVAPAPGSSPVQPAASPQRLGVALTMPSSKNRHSLLPSGVYELPDYTRW